ncbi:MAG TPA: FemAB family XrtA/PEP-CTERM system-associated protein [Dissulfurispiraceae bacterium]
MAVRLLATTDRERWDKYVMASDSSAYHQVGWKNIIEKRFGNKAFYLLSENEQKEIDGILPLIQLKSVLFGNFMVSLPYFNYGGICAETEGIGRLLLDEAVHIARREGAEHIELRHMHQINGNLRVKTAKVSMRLELPGDAADLMVSFTSKLRSQIRRPEKEGMYARIGREEELDSFYTAFSMNMRDLGTPVYSKEFFRSILREFPSTTRICTIYTGFGRPAASGFLVGFKERLEIPWASSLRSYNRYSPNMLLYWSALKFACENGYRIFDFGRSTPSEGAYRFKEQWGAKPVQLYWHYWLKDEGSLPELNPKNPRFRIAIIIWKRLPVGLTRLIGPYIVKRLP